MQRPELWYNYSENVLRILYPTGRVDYFVLNYSCQSQWQKSVFSATDMARARSFLCHNPPALLKIHAGHEFVGYL